MDPGDKEENSLLYIFYILFLDDSKEFQVRNRESGGSHTCKQD